MLQVKHIKKLLENFNDEDYVGIEENEVIYEYYAYDDEYCRKQGHPCLVIARE